MNPFLKRVAFPLFFWIFVFKATEKRVSWQSACLLPCCDLMTCTNLVPDIQISPLKFMFASLITRIHRRVRTLRFSCFKCHFYRRPVLITKFTIHPLHSSLDWWKYFLSWKVKDKLSSFTNLPPNLSSDIYLWPAGDVRPENRIVWWCHRRYIVGAAGDHIHKSCERRVSGWPALTVFHAKNAPNYAQL